MFDHSRLAEILAAYKQNFVSRLTGKEDEIFKWKAVKCFQDHWNVNVNGEDFSGMLERSLSETSVLLRSANKFPEKWIVKLAKQAPEEVRGMFIALFDENKDVFERIEAFKHRSDFLLKKDGKGESSHYQTENAITTYLWLRYPDKYYIYQFTVAHEVAKRLKADTDGGFKQGAYTENLRNFLKLYDDLNASVKEDTELVRLLESQLTDACYPDPQLKTLTVDVGYYIGKRKDAAAQAGAQGEGDDNDVDDNETADQRTSDKSPSVTPPSYDVYTKKDFLNEVYMTEERFNTLAAVLQNKKNIILQGAPGVGKTFAAWRLAWSMIGKKDKNRVAFVQFHQNYSYEDFMMGYKPVEDGFELRYGVIYRFCQEAAKRPDEDFFFNIDEINRVKDICLLLYKSGMNGLTGEGYVAFGKDTDGNIETQMEPWVQAEALVANLCAWKYQSCTDGADYALRIWDFIKDHLNDTVDTTAFRMFPMHDARACMQVLSLFR